MMKNRKRPERTCIVCREKFDKRDLNRIVLNKEGQIFFDETGKANGRGAYVCNNEACIEKFFKAHSLNKAFKRNFAPEEIEEIQKNIKEKLNSADSEDKL